jgi:hypothetical protein
MDLAYVDDVLGQPVQALHAFQQVLRLDPGNTFARQQVQRLNKSN